MLKLPEGVEADCRLDATCTQSLDTWHEWEIVVTVKPVDDSAPGQQDPNLQTLSFWILLYYNDTV